MGLGDFADKAKDFAGEHPDQVDGGLDKAGEFAKDKAPEGADEHIDTGVDKAGEYLGTEGGEEEGQQENQ